MIFDSHSHTEFSGDSEMKAGDALLAAERLGIGLVFTEHLDLDYPGDIDFTFDPDAYWNAYEPLRSDRLRLGVETGMQAATCDRTRAFTEWLPFDLVVGAIHMVDGKDIYYKEAYDGKSKETFYHDYYRTMAENVRSHGFIDVLAHIDYIARYAPYNNPEVAYGDFRTDIDEVLRAVIETDTVLELNTRRLGDTRAIKELVPVFARYYELGGRRITLGSDAHSAAAIGAHFAAALDFAEALKLQVVTFSGRLPENCQK